MKFLKNKKGFTLIELIVVMAIIGILVLLAAPKFLGYTKDAEVAAMQADAKVLSNAALLYNIENDGAWPTTGEAIVDLEAIDDDLEAYLDTLSADIDLTTAGIKLLDSTKLADYVKNTKAPVTNYYLITAGALEGEVVHATGVVDRTGTAQFGLVDNVVVQP